MKDLLPKNWYEDSTPITLVEKNGFSLIQEDNKVFTHIFNLVHSKDDGRIYTWVEKRLSGSEEDFKNLIEKENIKCENCRKEITYKEVEDIHKIVMLLKK